MKRVVVTGMGIVSCIGNSPDAVADSLKQGRSGIAFQPDYAELGFRCQVAGKPQIDAADHLDRKALRFMSDAAIYATIAAQQAMEDAGLTKADLANGDTGVVAGSGGSSASDIVEGTDIFRSKGLRRLGAYRVPRAMGSTCSANIANTLGIRGVSYSMSSACSTSAHCIGHGAELIQLGKQTRVLVGGGEQLHWSQTMQFDAMGALTTRFNQTPDQASRPYDTQRDGFVIAGGGGMLILEDYDLAKARGAKIYAEITGYGASSDGYDMVAPSGEGAERCMQLALRNVPTQVDYINTHGTSTPLGDTIELDAIQRVFGQHKPLLSSTKSLTGHSLGATGVQEAIYCLLMMQHGFVAASKNISQLDPKAANANIVQQTRNAELRTVLSNSFGFGGTNASLVFSKL